MVYSTLYNYRSISEDTIKSQEIIWIDYIRVIVGEIKKRMHTYVKALTKVASRYAPSRMLSFELIHVFKVFQLLDQNGRVSRESLGQDLGLGKSTTRTLLKHMKMQGLVQSTNGGTRLTHKGRTISSELFRYIPRES